MQTGKQKSWVVPRWPRYSTLRLEHVLPFPSLRQLAALLQRFFLVVLLPVAYQQHFRRPSRNPLS